MKFERLLPTMRPGGFIPSVHQQSPPDASLEKYRVYVEVLKGYCIKAAKADSRRISAKGLINVEVEYFSKV